MDDTTENQLTLEEIQSTLDEHNQHHLEHLKSVLGDVQTMLNDRRDHRAILAAQLDHVNGVIKQLEGHLADVNARIVSLGSKGSGEGSRRHHMSGVKNKLLELCKAKVYVDVNISEVVQDMQLYMPGSLDKSIRNAARKLEKEGFITITREDVGENYITLKEQMSPIGDTGDGDAGKTDKVPFPVPCVCPVSVMVDGKSHMVLMATLDKITDTLKGMLSHKGGVTKKDLAWLEAEMDVTSIEIKATVERMIALKLARYSATGNLVSGPGQITKDELKSTHVDHRPAFSNVDVPEHM